MSEPKHTAGPWEVEPLPENPKLHMIIAPKVGGVYTYVARTCFGPASRANAEYIVRACNAFPEILTVMEEVVADMEGHFCEVELIPSGSDSLIGSWRDMLKAAIAKAQPEEIEMKESEDHEPITYPCEWVCPICHQMETDELARDTHECDPELLPQPEGGK